MNARLTISNAVTARICSNTLCTRDGRTYKLKGLLNLKAAVIYGYSPEVLQEFKDGFPPDWVTKLATFFTSLKDSEQPATIVVPKRLLRVETTEQLDEGSPAKMPHLAANPRKLNTTDLANVTLRERARKKAREEVACPAATLANSPGLDRTADVFESSESIPQDGDWDTAPEDLTHDFDRTADIFEDISHRSAQENAIKLRNWHIVYRAVEHGLLFDRFAITVCGIHAIANAAWTSSEIVEVVSSRLLKTKTSYYFLEGPINGEACMEGGLSEEFVVQFKHGFPRDYEARLYEGYYHLVNAQCEEEEGDYADDVDDSEMYHTPGGHSPDWHSVHSDTEESGERPCTSGTKKPASTSAQKASRKQLSTSRGSKKAAVKPKANTCRAIAVPGDSTPTIHTSRSGRVIKPRLDTWAGERIRYDGSATAVAVCGTKVKTIGKEANSTGLKVVCTALGVETPPTPDGRRVSLPGEDKNKKKKKRSSVRTGKKKIVDYSILTDSDVDDASLFGDDDKAVDALTPIPLKATKGRRFVLNSPETETSDEDELNHAERRQEQAYKGTSRQATATTRLSKHRQDVEIDTTPAKRKPPQDTAEVNDSSSESSEGDDVEPPTESPKPKPLKKGSWKDNEKKRLMTLTKAANPVRDSDWEPIAAMLNRAVDACKLQAAAAGWKPRVIGGGEPKPGPSGTPSHAHVSARVGTAAFNVQADQATRDFLTTAQPEDDDGAGMFGASTTAANFTVAASALDDSLLAAFDSPVDLPKRSRKPAFVLQPVQPPRRSSLEKTIHKRQAKLASESMERSVLIKQLHHFKKGGSVPRRPPKTKLPKQLSAHAQSGFLSYSASSETSLFAATANRAPCKKPAEGIPEENEDDEEEENERANQPTTKTNGGSKAQGSNILRNFHQRKPRSQAT
ncbi:hypothetical protein AAVH_04378 [Aphelenchoides avenae]|nr:hypothetical protein AAVH_04378 [Aphelenchus avenae]